ncbi:MAG: purine-nucleoside phosphorylase [Campylobacterales bacterium]|nr:purine-nucleoside phosphorylase [Campylobacterales bacterium]
MIICAGERETFDFATPVGIGMTDVAINLTRLCIMNPPEFIVFVGTAGSYGDKKIFEIIESRTAANIENSFFSGAYTPVDNVVSTADDVSRETLINSSNYITTDFKIAREYLSHNIHLENMEFYAVLKVAKEFGIPAGGVFIVTNYCDANAHKDFVKNHAEAMKKLGKYMKIRTTIK